MGIRLSFGIGPLRASVPLTGQRRSAPARRTQDVPPPAAQPGPVAMSRAQLVQRHMEMCDELHRYQVLTAAEYATILDRLQAVADDQGDRES